MNKVNRSKLFILDFARGLAALWVLAAHVTLIVGQRVEFLSDGWIPVELFIYISGFLMFLILTKQDMLSFKNLIGFYLRRIFRIAPSFYLAIIIYTCFREFYLSNLVLAEAVFSTPQSVSSYVKVVNWYDILANVFFLHGLWHNEATKIFGPAWSLSLEMQFYAIAPFLVQYLKCQPYKCLTLIFIINAISNVIFGIYGSHGLLMDFFFPSFLPTRIFTFFLGAVTCFYISSRNSKYVFLLIASLIGYFMLFSWKSTVFCFALIAGILLTTQVRGFRNHQSFYQFSSPNLVELMAEWSYGIYLIHQFCMAIAAYILFKVFDFRMIETLSAPLYFLFVLFISLLIAIFIFYTFEYPARQWGKRIVDKLFSHTV